MRCLRHLAPFPHCLGPDQVHRERTPSHAPLAALVAMVIATLLAQPTADANPQPPGEAPLDAPVIHREARQVGLSLQVLLLPGNVALGGEAEYRAGRDVAFGAVSSLEAWSGPTWSIYDLGARWVNAAYYRRYFGEILWLQLRMGAVDKAPMLGAYFGAQWSRPSGLTLGLDGLGVGVFRETADQQVGAYVHLPRFRIGYQF